jgi:hypothetical protein
MFPRELEKLLADLRTQKRQSKSPAAQHSLAARIAAVCEALYGAAPEETPATPAKPVKTTVTVTRKPLEGVALLESARAALRAGVITNGQREALLHCKSGISPADFALLKSCRIIGVEQVLEPVPV